MNAGEISTQLGVSSKQVAAWVRKGMPSIGRGSKRTFDPAAVRLWLIDQGLASDDHGDHGRIVQTVAEVADHCEVSRRRVHDWKNEGMPWAPKRYDLDAIDAWRESKAARAGNYQLDLMRVRAERETLDLLERKAELFPVSVIRPLGERAIAIIGVLFDQIPDRLSALLPDDIGDDDRRRFMLGAKEVIDETREAGSAQFARLAEEVERPQ